jgi:hypothetical protein
LECNFFQVGHVTFFFNKRKRLNQVVNTTGSNLESRDSDGANFLCDYFLKQLFAQIFGEDKIIFEDLIKREHQQSENVVHIRFFGMLFESTDKFFMIRNRSRVIFLFNFFGDIDF